MFLIYHERYCFLSLLAEDFSEDFAGADPGFFLGRGALVSFSTSTLINHIAFFCRIPVVLENRRSSQGGRGVHPLHPPPRSTPALYVPSGKTVPPSLYLMRQA